MQQPTTTNAPSAYFIQRHILALLLSLLGFFLLASATGYFLQPDLQRLTHWLATTVGVWGLMALVFIGDIVLNPIPPDVTLLIVGQPPFRESWIWNVLAIGVASTLAGIVDYGMGRILARTPHGRRSKRKLEAGYGSLINKYGFWAVFIGAFTPLPFSVTCWAAGYFSLSIPLFFLAAIMRIPRFYIYYLVIDIGLQFPSPF